MTRRYAVHIDPVWRERANFVINASINIGGDEQFEQLWVRQLPEGTFEICCIPFFVYGLSLGDVVSTVTGLGHDYLFDRVVEPAGHHTYRVYFDKSFTDQDEVIRAVSSIGALVERSSTNLMAVDANDADLARLVDGLLLQWQLAGKLVFESGA
jgi:hypothetical protein